MRCVGRIPHLWSLSAAAHAQKWHDHLGSDCGRHQAHEGKGNRLRPGRSVTTCTVWARSSHPHAVLLKVSFQEDDLAELSLAGDVIEEAPELLA